MSRALGISPTDGPKSMADLARALWRFLVELKERSRKATEESLDRTKEPGAQVVIRRQGGSAARGAAALLHLLLLSDESAGAQPWSKLPMTLAARELGIGYEAFRPKVVKGLQVGRIWDVLNGLASGLAWETAERARPTTTLRGGPRADTAAAGALPADDEGEHNGAVHPVTTVEIIGISIQPTEVSHREVLKLTYEIDLAAEAALRVWLGASLEPERGGAWFHDMAHDVEVTLEPGLGSYRRLFRIPEAASPGGYRLIGAAWFGRIEGRALAYWDGGSTVTITSDSQHSSGAARRPPRRTAD